MTHGTIAGMLLSDLIAGRDNPWAALYEPVAQDAAREFANENLNVAAQYLMDYAPQRGIRALVLSRLC